MNSKRCSYQQFSQILSFKYSKQKLECYEVVYIFRGVEISSVVAVCIHIVLSSTQQTGLNICHKRKASEVLD